MSPRYNVCTKVKKTTHTQTLLKMSNKKMIDQNKGESKAIVNKKIYRDMIEPFLYSCPRRAFNDTLARGVQGGFAIP